MRYIFFYKNNNIIFYFLHQETIKIFNEAKSKGGVVFLSFGSVVELGSVGISQIEKAKHAEEVILDVFSNFKNLEFIIKYGDVPKDKEVILKNNNFILITGEQNEILMISFMLVRGFPIGNHVATYVYSIG